MKRLLVPHVVLALVYTLTLCPLNAGAQPATPPAAPPPASTPAAAPAPGAGSPQPASVQPTSLSAPLPVDYPAPPEPGVYISDRGAMLSIDSTKQINRAAAEIFLNTGVPVFVVTIRSVEHMGGDASAGPAGVEQYAKELFNKWDVGTSQDNRGVLILCSRGDNIVRLQLGKGWPETANVDAGRIVNDVILPPFRRSSAPEAILAGVKAVGVMIEADNAKRFPDRVARQDPTASPVPIPPSSPLQGAPTWIWIAIGVVVLIVLGFIVLLLKARDPGES
jgi:uncharacterized protein